MGIPALYLGNLVRLVAIFMVSRHDRSLFEVVHAYLGQVFTIFMVVLTCILWMKWVDKDESKRGTIMKPAGFLARFALISLCLFFLWMKVHYWYIRFLDWFIVFSFSLFNYHINLARQTVVYYETFSIVVFASLVLATRSISPWPKIRGLAAGLGFLFLIHLFHRIDNALMVYFNFTAAIPVDFTLLVVGQYLLPVLFLIYLVRRQNMESRDAWSFLIVIKSLAAFCFGPASLWFTRFDRKASKLVSTGSINSTFTVVFHIKRVFFFLRLWWKNWLSFWTPMRFDVSGYNCNL